MLLGVFSNQPKICDYKVEKLCKVPLTLQVVMRVVIVYVLDPADWLAVVV